MTVIGEEVVASQESISGLAKVVESLQASFDSRLTRSYDWRLKNLRAFQRMISDNMDVISEALLVDLNESDPRPHLLDCLREVDYMIPHLSDLMSAKSRTSEISWINFPARAEIVPEPLGTVLIVGTWNYPFHSALGPLPGAIAAGNTVLIKPGSLCRESSKCMNHLIRLYFNPKEIACIEGGIEIMQPLLNEFRFDHIFFTGGSGIGRIVMEAAAKYLTPVTLELGGKNPCVVTETADIDLAARRIAWGKWFTNAGQVCIAPDHLLVHESVADKLVAALSKSLIEFYPSGSRDDKSYCRIISRSHVSRLEKIWNHDKDFVVKRFGDIDMENKFVPPVIFDFMSDWDAFNKSACMSGGEIFGPLLPLVRYRTREECSKHLSGLKRLHGSPLVMYVFANEKARDVQSQYLESCASGAVVVNDCGIHIAEGCLPFGGVGKSGMGKYHSEKTFEVFSHFRSVLWKTGWLDVPFRYPPSNRFGSRMMDLFLWAAKKRVTPLRVAKAVLVLALLYKIFRR